MKPVHGIALKVASTFAFTLMLVCVKAVAGRIPSGEIVFARSFFALIPIGATLLWQAQLGGALRTARPWMHVSRAVVGIVAMATSFAALAFLPLPEAMMIGYAAPLITVALAALILGETVRLFRWSAVGIGLMGVAIILWPRLTFAGGGLGEEGALIGALLALCSAFFTAFAMIFVRTLVQTEATGTVVLYFTLSAAMLSLVSLPFGWVVPEPTDALALVAAGLLGGVGQLLLTSAYRDTGAATIATFDYTSMLWGIGFGYLFFGDVPASNVLVGGAIVVAAGIVIVLREGRLGLLRRRERRVIPTAPPQV